MNINRLRHAGAIDQEFVIRRLQADKFKKWLEEAKEGAIIGKNKCSNLCPIKAYLEESTVLNYEINVMYGVVGFREPMGYRQLFDMPKWCKRFVAEIDKTVHIEPVSRERALEALALVMSIIEEGSHQ